MANSQGHRLKLWKGGLQSVLNEKGLTMSWVCKQLLLRILTCPSLLLCSCTQRLCQTNSASEIQESLQGIRHRCQLLGIEPPILVTADNCCHIRNAVNKALPDTDVVLDVYHFLMR